MDSKEYYTVDCHPYRIKTGDLVQYKDNKYYFQSNGNVGYLYKDYNDFLARRNRLYAVARIYVKKLLPVGESHVEPEECEEELVDDFSKLVLEVKPLPPINPSEKQRAKELSAKRLKEHEKQFRLKSPPNGSHKQ